MWARTSARRSPRPCGACGDGPGLGRGDIARRSLRAVPAEPDLLALKRTARHTIWRRPGAELAEIVRKPAEAQASRIERDAENGRRLDEQLLDEADRPDMLPLVQFALQELFDRREVKGEDTLLTFAAYEEIGGLDGAIDKRAEAAVGDSGEAEQASAAAPVCASLRVPAREKGGAPRSPSARCHLARPRRTRLRGGWCRHSSMRASCCRAARRTDPEREARA